MFYIIFSILLSIFSAIMVLRMGMSKRSKQIIIGLIFIFTVVSTAVIIDTVQAPEQIAVAKNRIISYKLNLKNTYEFEYGEPAQIEYDDNLTLLGIADVPTDSTYSHMRLIKFQDNYGTIFTHAVYITVKDTQAPEIEGVKDITIEEGEQFSLDSLEIKANDKVDGALEIKYEGSVDSTTPGNYEIKVIAEDNNKNATEQTFIVNVEAKPTPVVETPKQTVQAQQSTPQKQQVQSQTTYVQPVQSIIFSNTGKTISYVHAGIDNGQSTMDNSPHLASTWEIIGSKVHSNTDGIPSYLTGHNYNAFSSVVNMQVGTTVTIKDYNGNVKTYVATDKYYINVKADGVGVITDNSGYNRIFNFTGEGIIMQTCTPNDTSRMILVEFRPA